MSYFGPIVASSSGITASNTTFAQLQAGGPSAHLKRLIAANMNGNAAPTSAATATATGGGSTGGALAAGTYYFVFTEGDGTGETTKSPEGTQLTVGAGNIPQFTFPSLKSGNTYRNLYLGAVGGSTGGPYTLYATGITTTTYSASAAVPANSFAVNPPAVNSTALTTVNAAGVTTNGRLNAIKAANVGRLQQEYDNFVQLVNEYLRGDPMSYQEFMQKVRNFHTVIAFLDTMCGEIGGLLDSNAGTLKPSSNAIGNSKTVRTFP